MKFSRSDGYSSQVDIFLIVDGLQIPAVKVCGDSIVLQRPCDLPPNLECLVAVDVDGRRQLRRVELVDGSDSSSKRVHFRPAVSPPVPF